MNKQRIKMVVVAAGALLASFSSAVYAASVAVVTDVQGRAMLSKESRVPQLGVLAEVESDARVQLDDKSKLVVVYYSSGAEYTFRGPAVVQFKAAAPEALSGSAPETRAVALASTGKDVRIKPGGLARAAYMMMGAANFLKLAGLSDTRTLDARPEFRWSALEPAVSYEFRIMSEAGRVVFASSTPNTSLTLPTNVSLHADTQYTWRVSAQLNDGTQSTAVGEFSIVPPELRAQVESARPAATAALSQQIAFALWLEQLELRDEARRYWEIARAQYPDDPRIEALARK